MAEIPRTVTAGREMQQLTMSLRAAGRQVGLVPTMGALHEGHLSLVEAAQAECDETVVTIFVNPTQFGPQEDFASYPRSLEKDLRILQSLGVGYVFAPPRSEIYPPGFSSYVEPPAVASRWEGRCRPGHFRGVVTVVLKLFHLIPARVAYFGEKDYQQCLVIRDMVAELGVPITLRTCPTVRESDGLARSSRNQYLDHEDRERARALPDSLAMAGRLFDDGERRAAPIAAAVQAELTNAGVDSLDYVAVADPDTLEPLDEIRDTAVVLIAARVGATRLIDNIMLAEKSSS